jgi:hypothetical protein
MATPTPYPVRQPAAAELLCRPEQAGLLKPFMRGERTVGQAAAELGLPVGVLHYRVVRFCRVGLLEVVREQPRRGRASKVYRAVSTDFLLPTRLLSNRTIQTLQQGQYWAQEVQAVLDRQLPPGVLEEVGVQLDRKGALVWSLHFNEPAGDPDHRPGQLQLRSAALFLDPADAQTFADELAALHARYQLKRGAKRYGMRLDLVPLDRPVDVAGGP